MSSKASRIEIFVHSEESPDSSLGVYLRRNFEFENMIWKTSHIDIFTFLNIYQCLMRNSYLNDKLVFLFKIKQLIYIYD